MRVAFGLGTLVRTPPVTLRIDIQYLQTLHFANARADSASEKVVCKMPTMSMAAATGCVSQIDPHQCLAQ
jgi:hypothetical protein